MGLAAFDKSAIEMLEGMISASEAELLFDLASQRRPGCIVEIGSWRGKSAIAMAMGATVLPRERRPMVYCIEPHAEFVGVYGGRFGPRDRSAFFRAMLKAGCADRVALVNLPSAAAAKAWKPPIGLLFVDGDHCEDAVQADVDAWAPFVIDSGIIAFDDALDEEAGPARVISRMLATGAYQRLDGVGKIVVLQKIRDNLPSEELRCPRAAAESIAQHARSAGYAPGHALERLRYGSFVSPQRRYMYVETPKAACTSIKQMLVTLEGASFDQDALPYHRETRLGMLIHQRRHVGMPTLLDVAAAAREEILSGEGGWFVFAVARNPYSRLVSVFENKIRLGEPGYRAFEARYGDRGPFEGPKAAFAAFVRDVISNRDHRESDAHFNSQAEVLMPGLIPYTRVFHLEEITQMTAAFGRHIADRGGTGPIELAQENTSAATSWRDYYDAESARAVADAYAEDFTEFGYDPADWGGGQATVSESPADRHWRSEVVARNAFIDRMFDWLDELRGT
jgi:predicted O-methyltransferase YrrM